MKRERISDLYEDFEPEMRIWPYWALGLLIPLVPLCLSLSISLSFSWQAISKYVISTLPLIFTAFIMKDGEKSWLLPLSGALYVSLTLILWVESSLEGAVSYPLGIPLAFAISPSILSLAAFSFFLKRKRGKWILPFLLSLLLSSSLVVLSVYSGEEGIMIYRGIYPLLLVLLSLSVVFVTRRSDSTPWFVFLLLILLLISSSLFHSGIMSMAEGEVIEGASFVSSILGVFVHDTEFWYTLTFLFVFAGLSGKSSYRTVVEDIPGKEDNIDDDIEDTFRVRNERTEDVKYTYPPSSSRFSGKTEEVKREEPAQEEPPRPRYEDEPRQSAPQDDKWYEFISGGVREERRENRSRDSYRDDNRIRRDDYDDYYRDSRRDQYYRDDERTRRRDDGYYRDGYRDIMDDDRRYVDERRYRDDRRYRDRDEYPRRDDRDYRRDDDYYRDRQRRPDYDDWDRNH